ncbi:hypothetical protein PHLH3_33280 [Pseudomonas sp. St386]|nr:hypothetical protein PHLH3_33280 [Pseudomonas sp. St386]
MSAHSRTELEGALAVCKGSFLSVGFFSFFVNLLMLVPSFYMLQVYDRAVGSASLSTLLMLTLIMLLLMITMGGLEWVRSRIMVRISTRLDTLLSQRLFDASFKQALNTSGMNATAQPLSDLNGLRQFLTGNGLFAFFDAPWIPIYLAVMFMFHSWYGWMGIVSAVLLGALAFANEKLTHSPLQTANREQMAATAFTNKSLRNAEVVQSMGMLASLRQHWSGRTHKVLALQSLASDRAATMTSVSRTFRQIVQSLVLGLGAYLAINHEISSGLMIAGSILLGRALAPIDQLIGVWKGFLGARSQYARLHELLLKIAAEPERMSLPAPEGAICVEGLSAGPPTLVSRLFAAWAFRWLRAKWWASLVPVVLESRPWPGRCWASGLAWPAPYAWTARTSANGVGRSWARTSAICHRTSSCSRAPSARTFPASAR